jgi:CubicO group peptidase (beta-lactamase class C family)/uncharacterized protein YjbI with pentapeptide repeats
MRLATFCRFTFVAVFVSGWVFSAFADLPMTGVYVPEFQAVDNLLQNFMAGKPIPGGTITITLNDKVIYERGIGYSNAANTVPMQETALMRLASVSKPVTASAIQQLAKDGQLNLNDKVFNIDGNGGILNITPHNGVLGDNRLRDITVQHLLGHQGGWNRDIVGDHAFRDVLIANAMGVPSPPGILNTAKYILSRPLQFTPGTNYNYSNVGYMFLGMVVEEASGQAYETYVDNYVLAPAGIPAWEVDAGRTFAADQNPREPVYSDPALTQNVFNPTGPSVAWPYGGWDNERILALGGLIASSKAMATLAQDRIVFGPEIGKLRSDYTTAPEYWWYHGGSLPGTDTLVMGGEGVWGGTWKDASYSILFDRRPTTATSYSNDLALLLEPILEGIATWPAPLVYAGDFTNDQWLTPDDITLFTHALALGSEAAFTQAYPTARYGAGDFDGDGLVNASDADGLIAALQHAGVPDEFVSLVPELPGDFNRDGVVDAADYVVWRKNFGLNINLPNETMSLGLVDQADYDVWRSNFGNSLGSASGASLSADVPEPSAFFLVTISLVGVALCYRVRRRSNSALQFFPAILPLVAFAAPARADIFQWEYINLADPSQGKRQSTTLAPDGAGVDAVPGAFLFMRDLTRAYLIGADLRAATINNANLTEGDLSQANLASASLGAVTLTNANLNHANLSDAFFGPNSYLCGDDICTAPGATFTGADLTYANATRASFRGSTLTDANFTGANIQEANFSKWSSILLWGTGISLTQLYSTASYRAGDLSGVEFGFNDLTGGNFAGLYLADTSFFNATLTDADFSNAEVRGTNFGSDLHCMWSGDAGLCLPNGGPTLSQLYSTASYQAFDLTGINLEGSDLSGGNFAGLNLTDASFAQATLIGANFSQANLTNTYFFPNAYLYPATLSDTNFSAADARGSLGLTLTASSIATNLIHASGNIDGLNLSAGDLLVVRDYDGDSRHEPHLPPIPITIDQHMSMGSGGTLRMVFEADVWDSTVSFAPGIPVTLGGTLEITFAGDVNLASQVGRTFDLFDWTGVIPIGVFAFASPYSWDLSNLYTTGEVTLTAVPEPANRLLQFIGAAIACLNTRSIVSSPKSARVFLS